MFKGILTYFRYCFLVSVGKYTIYVEIVECWGYDDGDDDDDDDDDSSNNDENIFWTSQAILFRPCRVVVFFYVLLC